MLSVWILTSPALPPWCLQSTAGLVYTRRYVRPWNTTSLLSIIQRHELGTHICFVILHKGLATQLETLTVFFMNNGLGKITLSTYNWLSLFSRMLAFSSSSVNCRAPKICSVAQQCFRHTL